MNKTILYGLLLVSVLCIIVNVIKLSRSSNLIQLNINGVWMASESFLRDSQTDMFMLNISDLNDSTTDKNGYIIIKQVDRLLANNDFEVCIKPMDMTSDEIKTSAVDKFQKFSFEIKSESDIAAIPKNLTMYLYSVGKIILFDKDIIFAVLYKDAELSDLDCQNKNYQKDETVKKVQIREDKNETFEISNLENEDNEEL
jgi:hypothetical protein